MQKNKSGLIVLAMALGLLMASLDNTITSAALGHILTDIGGFEQVSWVFTAYMLASTSTMLVFGKMSDIFGRKLFYLIGVAIFLLGSALCGMAQDMTQLIVFRAIQGIGAGALFPISFTIIYTIFADPKDAAKMSGVFAGIFGLSSVAGPQIGTLLSEYLGWRWCFYVNLPIGLIAFLVLLVALQESRSERRPKIDYLGTVTLIISTVSFMLAMEWGGKDYSWSSWPILGLFALSLAVGIAFVLIERRAAEPILPLVLFRNRMVTGISLACLCQGAVMFSAIAYLPLFSTAVLGQANSNGILTPMMLSLMLGAVAFGFLQALFAYRTLIAVSMLAGVAVCFLLSTVGQHTSGLYLTGLMVMLGFGAVGPLMSVAQNAMAASVDPKYIGISSSFVGFWRNIGGVLGASIMATIVNGRLQSTLEAGAASHHIPPEQIGTLANPELLVRGGGAASPEVLGFIRDSLEAAINHGFAFSMIFGAVGLLAALLAGPGRYVRPGKSSPQTAAQTAVPEGTA